MESGVSGGDLSSDFGATSPPVSPAAYGGLRIHLAGCVTPCAPSSGHLMCEYLTTLAAGRGLPAPAFVLTEQRDNTISINEDGGILRRLAYCSEDNAIPRSEERRASK